MAKKMKGTVVQFGTKGYGFIEGDDGRKYFVHQKNTYHQSRLELDTRVVFAPQESEKGWVAADVALENAFATPSAPLSNVTIKALFAVLFVTQIIVIYQVFFKS